MKYILNERAALREWNDTRHPFGVIIKNYPKLVSLSKEEFEILKCADGKNEISEDTLKSEHFKKIVNNNLIHEASEGEELSDWQKLRYYDNPNYNTISLRLTGRCNYNCKHCFNAADINKDNFQWTYEEAEKLINEASDCGIRMFRITGGEPMLHPDFLKILKLIADKRMITRDIITNGAFITQAILDEIKKINKHARFYISFDGLNHHDWMRGKEGIEKKTIDAIKLCIDNGFVVVLDVQVNAITMDTLFETAEFFDQMGVQKFRLIRTTETPRWREYAGDAVLSVCNYFDFCVNFLNKYYSKERKMDIICWQFGWFKSTEKKCEFAASRCDSFQYRDSIYSCNQNADTVSLGANGNMYPCHQISGQYDLMGWKLPNVKQTGLKEAMRNQKFLHDSRVTLGDIVKSNIKCKECLHFKQCGGGCRTCAILLDNNNILGSDPYMCSFYEGNYAEKVSSVLSNWEIINKPTESHYGSCSWIYSM